MGLLGELWVAEEGRPVLLYFILLFYNIGHNDGTLGDKYFLWW